MLLTDWLPMSLTEWLPVGLGAGVMLTLCSTTALILVARHRRHDQPPLALPVDLAECQTLDEAAAHLLDAIAIWIPAQAYHAYWLSEDVATLRLRASLRVNSRPQVAPDYSGLVQEGGAPVPLALPADPERTQAQTRGAQDERWLDLPIGPHLLVAVLLGELGQVPPRDLQRLTAACATFAPLTLAVHQWFAAREEANRTRGLVDATRLALDATLRTDRAIELLLGVCSQVVEAAVPVAVVEGTEQPLVVATTPTGSQLGAQILAGDDPGLTALPLLPDVVPGSRLSVGGSSYNACVRSPLLLDNGDPVGCFFLFTKHAPELNPYQTAVLRTLGQRAAQLLANQRQMQAAAANYGETLRVLVTAMDGLSPYSQGHSDRLARLARMCAAALGTGPREAEAVALAAYFHDVGMVAVDPRIVLKPQQLTPDEYQQVKRHAELGAQLVASLPAALPLAPMVAGHHERWDGHGYPRGLKGEEIPLGARILAAADAFDASTTGRPHRPAVPFAQAVENLQAAAGSHLDPQVVAALIQALRSQEQTAAPHLPAAPCWVLKQMPEHICAGCPNRSAEAVRCWENPDRLCTRHGDSCEVCVVYTAAQSRQVAH